MSAACVRRAATTVFAAVLLAVAASPPVDAEPLPDRDRTELDRSPTLRRDAAATSPLRKVAVIGDSMSAGLAAPLRAAVDNADRALDWRWWVGFLTPAPDHVWSELLEERPDVIVMFFAPWEREVLAAGGMLDATDPGWVGEYRRTHVDPWLDAVRASGSHVYWVGMPRSRFDVAPASHADLNAVWEAVAADEPAMTWVDGASVIDDPAGGHNEFDSTATPPIRLFNEDGLHLCPAGTVRIAEVVLAALAEDYAVDVNPRWRSTDWAGYPGAFGPEGCDQPRRAVVPVNVR